ncbi:phosphotransferase family protein [Nocardia sp. R16R-3T]
MQGIEDLRRGGAVDFGPAGSDQHVETGEHRLHQRARHRDIRHGQNVIRATDKNTNPARHTPRGAIADPRQAHTARPCPALNVDDHAWTASRAEVLVAACRATRFPLGHGLIHADAHSENAVKTDRGFVLIDWDGCCLGPGELDLISGLPDHFQEPEADRHQFLDAYGHDILGWPTWRLLRDIAELHSIGSYIRLAPDKPVAAEQLQVRIGSQRTGDSQVRWTAVS